MNRGQSFLLFVLLVVSVLALLIVLPFVDYVLLAIILAYVLYPIHRRLVGHTGEFLSPLLLITGSLLVVFLPLLYLAVRFVRDLRALARGETGLQVDVLEREIASLTGTEINLAESIQLMGQVLIRLLFGDVPGVFIFLLQMSLGIALVLFLVFYLLRDGPEFVAWLRETTPLPRAVVDRLCDQIDRTTWGAVIGHGFSAMVQTIVAALGLYVVGIPNIVFWTFVMFVLAFLPLIGVFLVWGPAAMYLYLIGNTFEGVLLALYGLTVVSMIDYYVRPLVIDRRARLNPAVILVGVFGGLYTIGFIGLFVGPITIGVFVAILKTVRMDFDDI